MESCKYHPDTAPNFRCDECRESFCTQCVDHSVAGEARCFQCGALLRVRVSADSVDPLSKRLKKAFLYPLNPNAMGFIIGLSLVTTALSLMPIGEVLQFIAMLFCSGLAVNYSFLCLKATSVGHMEPPRLGEAVEGSFSILIRLFAMFFLIGLAVMFLGRLLGPLTAIIMILTLVVVLPAILMCFAMSDHILWAVSPDNVFHLIKNTGLPYWVLIIFLFIMFSSVSLLSSWIGDEQQAFSAFAQSSISSYYSMVEFHLMGYLLYQHQDKLGITAQDIEDKLLKAQSPASVALAHANLRLKAGNYSRATAILQQAIASDPKNTRLWQRYFELLCRLEDKPALQKIADRYFHHLLESAQTFGLLRDAKKLYSLLPDYMPEYAHLRFHLASEYYGSGDAETAIRLLSGLHKRFPEYGQLIEAYALMKQALETMPGMEEQVSKCQTLLVQLERHSASA
ncbi:tetratricopeptide repeat protein [Marinobacterium sp. D7]|uniref:tetratricopeptide repeat protein n=1 Tax=Marinobacterium ramblicola TaxID=2849041 RepID=UPI001C2D5D4F|nr:tetratricopeptide repeat protein [Marinobacterium ramblicola]MBV1788230.1 tetratricopeptide repeat protein [Marinobacterium ramblicola]